MGRLLAFNSISLDGYFTDANGDMSWAYNSRKDEEWDAYVAGNASGEGVLVFGRITYELMKKFWPTPAAMQSNPVVARRMNSAHKIVFSRTMESSNWENTRFVKNDMAGEIRRLKKMPDVHMVILGSGSIIAQLTQERLIDEYQFVITPMIIGKGRTMFEGAKEKLSLRLTSSRTFSNGNVVLVYVPLP
jgi:dihydrofolate reductase